MLRHASSLVSTRHSLNALRRTFSVSQTHANAVDDPEAAVRPAAATLFALGTQQPEGTKKGGSASKGGGSSSERGGLSSRRQFEPKSKSKARPQDRSRLLRPPVLASRIQALASQGLLDDAVALLHNAPLDAQNVVVWNTTISEVMQAKKYKVAFGLYIDMKRRGFVPNSNTYATLLKGYSQITEEQWMQYTQQLENVHKAFENFMAYADTMKLKNAAHTELNNAAITHYFAVLGRAGLHQRLFEVYNLLDSEGPLAPGPHLYSSMFSALGMRKTLPPSVGGDVHHQNASDAKLIWKQMIKNFAKNGHQVDSHLVRGLLMNLGNGRPADQLYAFDVIREYLGLVPPGEPVVEAKVPLNPFLLDSVLHLCMLSKKHSLCMRYLLRIMEQQPHVVEAKHCETALRANAARASLGSLTESSQALEIVEFMLREAVLNKNKKREVWPTILTYRYALCACWHNGDWMTAVRLFELMTRLDADAFLDSKHVELPRQERTIWPDAPVMSFLVRTALASAEPADMRQCLRMVERVGLVELGLDGGKQAAATDGTTRDRLNERNHYRLQYAQGVVDLVGAVLKSSKKVAEGEGKAVKVDAYALSEREESRWTALRKEVRARLREKPAWVTNTSLPWLEESVLGSARGVAAMDSHVDYQMTNRHIKSAQF